MADKKISALLLKQHALMDSMRENMRIFKERNVGTTQEGYVKAKLSGLEELWGDFKANHKLLLAIFTEETIKDEDYFQNQVYSQAEDLFCEYMGYYRELLPDRDTTSDTFGKDVRPKIKLPTIPVPTFDGNLQDWCNFRNLFRTLIHDRHDISDIEKLQYLKGSLKGEASNIVKHFDITAPNYKTAWSLLVDRYENPRLMIDALLTKIPSLPSVKTESITAFKSIFDTVNECLHSLTNLNVNVTSKDPLLLHLLVPKLPTSTIKDWEKEVGASKTLPPLSKFLSFLTNAFQTMEASKRICLASTNASTVSTSTSKIRSFLTNLQEVSSCIMCGDLHSIRNCSSFLQLTIQGRFDFLKGKQICRNCLSLAHSTAQCRSTKNCKHCQRRHHTLLHMSTNREVQPNDVGPSKTTLEALNQPKTSSTYSPAHQPVQLDIAPPTKRTSPSGVSTSLSGIGSSIAGTVGISIPFREISLLATVLLSVSYRELSTPVSALVDPGSQATFVTTRIAQILRAITHPVTLQISGLSGVAIGSSLARTTMNIASTAIPGFTLAAEMITLPKLTNLLPPNKVPRPDLGPYRHLPLADPQFDSPGPIDMLLGVDVYAKILVPGLHTLSHGLKLQATKLGWIIFGSIPNTIPCTVEPDTDLTGLHAYIKEDTTLQKFWELESVPEESAASDVLDPCDLHYVSNTIRRPDGRYQVKLPFRDKSLGLGRSGHIARAAFLRMEKRLLQSPSLYRQYQDCFQEYLTLGHMQPTKTSENHYLFSDENNKFYRCFYLPHHGVVKESSTTKLRVVFNASQKTDNGCSLNDLLHTSPTLQNDIAIILLQWRLFPIALTADIAKMYRQIWIHPSDQAYQRVLWRSNPTLPIMEFQLKTVTFGVTTAPYLALRTLLQLASDEKETFPQAAKLLQKNFYVDDFLGGGFDVTTTTQSIRELRALLQKGRFHLRKWISNHKEVLHTVPIEDREPLENDHNIVHIIKTFGVGWNPTTDHLIFNIPPFSSSIVVNKRSILSWIAGLYDPLGLLAPVIITCKIFMQKLWLAGVTWDDPITGLLLSEWETVAQRCCTTRPLSIPRWFDFHPERKLELHGFCDASKKAYAAILYLRAIDSTGFVTCNLVMSKTRVAPTKTVTIPRLELCGAVLLVKLLQYLRRHLSVLDLPVVLWTDSQVVLAWLRREPKMWTTFVANRVSFIHSHTRMTDWEFVNSSDNPADMATRGISATQITDNILWWSGPSLLSKPSYDRGDVPIDPDSVLAERRKQVIVSCQLLINMTWINDFSSLTRLVRVTAYILRFTRLCKSVEPRPQNSLSSMELNSATLLCIRSVQQSRFTAEITALEKGRPLPSKSPLLSLNPNLDTDGILRVGGRLANSGLSFTEKHPIILPSLHPFTTLVIRHAHAQTLHGGTEMTSAYVRATYWILHTRSTVRKVLHHCTTCFRYKRHSSEQLMADFPHERVCIARLFTYTGADYAGPIVLKSVGVRSTKTFKGYIALFVCFTTKTYHLELVSDLTKDVFLAAFKRFIGRRGLPHTVFSDCGTNFVEAHNLLIQYQKEVTDFSATRGIEWKFIPPASPHFGGLWEAGVKLVKAHLKRILGTTILTFEEYLTLLTQIEACLNSRPICPISNDPRDYAVLTPGHFLTGSNLMLPPQPDQILNTPSNHLHRWQRVQQLFQTFWRRWSTDYLSRQQPRAKWKRALPNLRKDDLVLIKDERLAPLQWRKGRIVNAIGGADNLVRVATVQTADGIIKRPVTKLFKLPIETSDSDNQVKQTCEAS